VKGGEIWKRQFRAIGSRPFPPRKKACSTQKPNFDGKGWREGDWKRKNPLIDYCPRGRTKSGKPGGWGLFEEIG